MPGVERAPRGREEGYLTTLNQMYATVDSGATSTAISYRREQKEKLLKEVTSEKRRTSVQC